MAKRTYDVKERLSHDGVDCVPGGTVEMEESRAEGLLKDGVIALPVKLTKGKGGARKSSGKGQQAESELGEQSAEQDDANGEGEAEADDQADDDDDADVDDGEHADDESGADLP